MTELRTPEQMAAEVGVHVKTLLAYARRGVVPALRLGSRVVRFEREAVIRAMREAR